VIFFLTGALDGLVNDLPRTEDPELADLLVLGSQPMDFARFPRVRGLFRVGAGRENVPWAEAERRGVRVAFPSRTSLALLYDEVAGFSAHLILASAYGQASAVVAWRRERRGALSGRRLLVLGLGNVGRRVASRMAAFLHVTTLDARRPREELRARLAESDVVSLHLPLAENTRGLLGATELARLPDQAAVVNTARAALVDEAALLAEIGAGRLRAAFDVFWQEPYRGPLAAFHPDRFRMSPHVAGSSREFLEAAAADLRVFARSLG
jgi:D-3-phosphoglycerate dehydrogenase